MKYLGVVLVLSLIGIEQSYGFIRGYNEMRNNCALEGGFCINIIPPPPPRRLQRRRGPGRGRGRMPRTKTKKGTRNNRGRGAAGAGARPGPGAAAPGPAYQPPAYQPQQPAWQPPQQPRQQQNSFFSGFNPLWFMFGTRKKRQAAEPPEPGEIPRIRRNENVGAFLNTHCRATEFDFSCQRTGGVCCTPIP